MRQRYMTQLGQEIGELGPVGWRREPTKGRVQHEVAAHDRRRKVHVTPVQRGARVDASGHRRIREIGQRGPGGGAGSDDTLVSRQDCAP